MPPPAPASPLRTIAFGVPAGGPWGVGWFAGGDGAGLIVLGRGKDAQVLEATLDFADGTGPWQARTAGGELTVAPIGEAVAMAPDEHAPSGHEQLCEVSGAALGGVAVRGCRGERGLPQTLSRYDSVREVSAWFGDDEAAALIALRPRRHRGQEQDEIAAAVIDAEGSAPVADPRLSTTYAASGAPARMGLELWPEDPEGHPRRVAGEALGPGTTAAGAGWRLQVAPLLCHSHGREGAGAYVLAHPV